MKKLMAVNTKDSMELYYLNTTDKKEAGLLVENHFDHSKQWEIKESDLTPYQCVENIEMDGLEDLSEEQASNNMIASWQYLHDTKVGYSLQGFYGRALTQLLEQGTITR